ncbi:MAG TPA: peptidoglycan-binding protein [Candidatus Paceibacterota bacterium]
MNQNEEKYIGVIEQTEEQKEQNYAFAEIVAEAEPVIWKEKQKPNGINYIFGDKFWRKFDVRNQSSSGSCVAQSMAKLMGILAYLRWGIFIVFSAGHIYLRRINKNWASGNMGMIATDVYSIAQKGVTLEEFMAGQNLGESGMNALYENDLHKAVNLKIGNYIVLPVGDIEAVASVIQKTKKGVMTWLRFWNNEWTAVPVVIAPNPDSHHSMATVDFTLYEKEKSLVNDESWGNTYGFEGQRVIKESFYRARNTHASYPMDFKFDFDAVPMPDKKSFSNPLVFIEIDSNTQVVKPQFAAIHAEQKADVVRLQDALKKEGVLPSNIASTGLYQNLTAKAVKAFQIKHSVASMAEINSLGGKRVGEKTLAKLNQIYG